MEIYDAQVNHLTNPLGFYIDRTFIESAPNHFGFRTREYRYQPVFNWKVRGARGKQQQSARIVVASDEKMNSILIDTGWKEYADSFWGKVADSLGWPVEVKFTPRTRYWWQVSVRDNTGDEAASDVQWFETAKIDEEWVGKWISCGNEETRLPIFTKAFDIPKPVAFARLYICGLGLYEAAINGGNIAEPMRVGDEYLTPYGNDYNEWVQYQTFDVTSRLHAAGDKAQLAVTLGNGWYKGRYGFDVFEEKGFYGDSWCLIAELRITYSDGTTDVVATDDTWQVTRSNITYSTLYDGEHRDDTLDEVPRVNAVSCKPPKGQLCVRRSLPVRVQQTITPIELIRTPAGESVFDLGQEITGIFELKVDLPRGSKVRIQTGEILQGGNFYRDNLRSAKSEYLFTSGGTPAVIKPQFTFYGFRYVKVEGIENLAIGDFKALALWSDFHDRGTVETGHELLNKFISNVRWGLRDNFVDIPTDCPQRDERMGWTGDAQVFASTACYLVDPYAFYSKFLYDMSREQADLDGAVPIVVPSAWHPYCSSVWGDAACIMPWCIYQFYGTKSILLQQYTSMKSWVDYMESVDGSNHAWQNRFHFGDWLALDHPAGGAEQVLGGTNEGFIAGIYFAASAQILSQAAAVLGYSQDADRYAALSKAQFDYVRKAYYTPTGRCAINTQTALILTLKYHLSSDEELTKSMLLKLFDYSGMKLRTGFVGTPLLCDVLTENGMTDVALALLLNEDSPGWLHEVKLGATTVWERWNSLLDDGTISGIGMNSMNHYAYGSVLEWVFRYLAGLNFDADAPGCCRATIRPVICREIGHVSAQYDSPSGVWRTSWAIADDGTVTVKVTVPFGCTATVMLPRSATVPAKVRPLTPGNMKEAFESEPMEWVENTCTYQKISGLDAGEYGYTYRLDAQ